MGAEGVADDEGVRQHERDEDRHPGQHRLLRAAQVQQRQQADPGNLGRQLVVQAAGRQQAEERVRAARDRERDGQHVIDQQRGAGYHPQTGREQFAGHQVAAAARREQLDDLRVAGADDEYRHDRRRRDKQAQVNMAVQGLEGLLRTVARRRQPVRAQPNPREEGDERELVEKALVREIARFADQDRLQPAAQIHVRHNTATATLQPHPKALSVWGAHCCRAVASVTVTGPDIALPNAGEVS